MPTLRKKEVAEKILKKHDETQVLIRERLNQVQVLQEAVHDVIVSCENQKHGYEAANEAISTAARKVWQDFEVQRLAEERRQRGPARQPTLRTGQIRERRNA